MSYPFTPIMNEASYELLTEQYVPDIDLHDCLHVDVGVHGHVLITRDRRVIKIPTVQRALSLVNNEQKTLEYFQQHISTHIARILHIIDAPAAPAGYILEMEHAAGDELHPQDLEGYSYQELTHLGYKIGTFISELHTMPLDSSLLVKHIPIPDLEQELSLIHQNTYWNILENIEQEYLISIYERALPYFQNTILEVSLHNDFGMNHVFVQNHALSAVIDWDCQKVGDPARDWRWAVGPRSIHPQCFIEALSTYMESMKPDPSFIGRVIFYNEIKAVNTLARAKGAKDLMLARKSLVDYREAIKFLKDYPSMVIPVRFS